MRKWFKVHEKEGKLELQGRSVINAFQSVGPPPFSSYASLSSALPPKLPLAGQVALLIGMLFSTLFLFFNFKKWK